MKKIFTYLMISTLLIGLGIDTMAQSCVKVEVSGFRAHKGKLFISIYKNQDSFLKIGKEVKTNVVRVNDTSSAVETDMCGLEPGWYAVALYHDEDDNDRMNTGFFGLPKEPYGLSNNVRPRFSYPRFTQCKFYVPDKEEKKVSIGLVLP